MRSTGQLGWYKSPQECYSLKHLQISLQFFANKNLRPMSCIEERFLWRFLFAICLFQNCKISCAMNSWCLSCSLPHVQSEWKGICLICLKYKVIFIEMVWAPRFTLKQRQTATQKRTIVWDEDDYGFVVLLQRRCALSVIFPHVALCNMLFGLQSTNDFYWMFFSYTSHNFCVSNFNYFTETNNSVM